MMKSNDEDQPASFFAAAVGSVRQSKPNSTATLKISDASTVVTQQRVSEPFTLFLVERGNLLPISDDADLIFTANSHSVEEHCTEQFIPAAKPRDSKTGRSDKMISQLEDSGVLSRELLHLQDQSNTINASVKKCASPKGHATLASNGTVRLDVSEQQTAGASDTKNKNTKDSRLPTEETLQKVTTLLSEKIPKFFRTSMDYSLVTQDIVLENNLRDRYKVTVGYKKYASEMFKMKTLCNFLYASIDLYIIKITSHPENGTIKVRWTMKCVSQFEAMKFWKFNLFNLRGKRGVKEKIRDNLRTHDGFNVFHVNPEGGIYKIRLDRVIPEEKNKVSEPVAALGQRAAETILGGNATSKSTTS